MSSCAAQLATEPGRLTDEVFTGIVQALKRVDRIETDDNLTRLWVDLRDLDAGLEFGASVAINGCCLTVADNQQGSVRFDVIPETQRQTNLGSLAVGDQVNVERSLRLGDELGGHRVSGHITGTAKVVEVRAAGHDCVVALDVPEPLRRYVFPKGFVALNGASLTISSLDRSSGSLEVSLIPETLSRTNFGHMAVGDVVNIEVDAEGVATVDTITTLLADPEWRASVGLGEGSTPSE